MASELTELRTAVDQLTQGLQLMLETQATHTEMLLKLLQAATQPASPSQALEATLTQIATILRDHGGKLDALHSVMKSLPSDVGSAVALSVRDGLGKL
jgi:small-conductance mechanosensitive channel